MARVSVFLVGVFLTTVAAGVPTHEARAATTPPQDFVVGGGVGTDAGWFRDISIDARSDPLGGGASGIVSFGVEASTTVISGPVTCLAVDGTHAIIGFTDTTSGFGPITVSVTDNSAVGKADEFDASPFPPPDCSTDPTGVPYPVIEGDIVVRDAPSKTQCQQGGWTSYTDETGQPFSRQGDCIAYALGVA